MKLVIFLFFSLSIHCVFAQNTQTIRGVVLDSDIKTGLAYANVYLLDSLSIGTVTDSIGRFELNDIPIGRHLLGISHTGYKNTSLSVLVNAGKSNYIEISITPDINILEEIVIKKSLFNKRKSINKTAATSVRAFSIEETEKYAGSLGDPARMAQNFAGVSFVGDSRNDIIIRGNSPFGLLWRIDGVEVTNPNHFGAKGSTGGPITILNNNFLTNSDFFTSAFPAEYGNAFSGVFDLRMRKGNTKKYGKTFQIGWNGVELGLEGPIKKGKSSFIFAYRYANLFFLKSKINGVPKYQDITIKSDFTTKKIGDFSFMFIGGLSSIQIDRGKVGQTVYSTSWNINAKNNKVITFLNHKIGLNKTSSIKSFISFGLDANKSVLYSKEKDNAKFIFASLDETDFLFSAGSTFRKRVNTKNIIDIGAIVYKHGVKYIDSVYVETVNNVPQYYFFADVDKNNIWQMQSFIQWKHNFSSALFSYVGVNYNYLLFNNTYSIEPRFGMNYSYRKHNIGIGYGLVGKPLAFVTYFTKDDKTNKLGNLDLGFFKSHQFSLSDNILMSKNFRVKIEAYYQSLYNIPIYKHPSYFSLVNFGTDFFQKRPPNLVSKGKGENYGIEFTAEKFLHNNWYFLSTLSLFRSKYLASDNKWRSSQFDNNYIINILGGYEFKFKNNYTFQINNKLTLAGGKPLKEYLANGDIDEDHVFNRKGKTYFRNDLRLSLIKNSKNKTHELSIDLQNITNNKNEYMRIFNHKNKEEEVKYQMGFLPIITYRLTF